MITAKEARELFNNKEYSEILQMVINETETKIREAAVDDNEVQIEVSGKYKHRIAMSVIDIFNEQGFCAFLKNFTPKKYVVRISW